MTKYGLFFLFFSLSVSAFAKSICELERSRLQKIQSAMKHGMKPQVMEHYRDIERKRHSEYQVCRQFKNNQNLNHVVANKKHKPKKTKIKKKTKLFKKKSYPRALVNSRHAVVIKGRYKGDKQNYWLKFYTPPYECIKPKSTSQFASCMNHRNKVAKEFDLVWRENTR